MPTPTPLPVIVTNASTDWWAQLLDGILGAVVAAVVSALVAIYVVRRQHRSDRRMTRELAALEAAEALTRAALESYPGVGYQTGIAAAKARDLLLSWSSAVMLKSPALVGFFDVEVLHRLTDEFDHYVALTDRLASERHAAALDERTGLLQGDEDRQRQAATSIERFDAAHQEVLARLAIFRSAPPA